MSAALDMLRAFARGDVSRSPSDEKNEINERTPAQERVSSFNSFVSLSDTVDVGDFDERSALVEFGAGVPREWAKGFARLDPMRPPSDVPPHRWLAFVEDVGRFLDSGFAEQAAALGWGPYDLFCCARDRPFARIDHEGLLWLLDGGKVVELYRTTAGIETETGARQTFRRRPVPVGHHRWAGQLTPSPPT